MTNLSITLIQADLVWENRDANLDYFAQHIAALPQSDLIILPETFTTGFSMNSKKLAEPMDGVSMQWMKKQAQLTNAVICGSIILQEEDNIFNRFIWMRPDGTYEKYDKRHLFRMGEEHQNFTSGSQKLTIELNGWKLCPMICYDLRFPVWSRNQEEYDALIYVANWPEVRIEVWEKLLYARAIENQCYVAAVNRVGQGGNELNYVGNSMLIDPRGNLLWKGKKQTEESITMELSLEDLNCFREKFPVGKDADSFQLV